MALIGPSPIPFDAGKIPCGGCFVSRAAMKPLSGEDGRTTVARRLVAALGLTHLGLPAVPVGARRGARAPAAAEALGAQRLGSPGAWSTASLAKAVSTSVRM